MAGVLRTTLRPPAESERRDIQTRRWRLGTVVGALALAVSIVLPLGMALAAAPEGPAAAPAADGRLGNPQPMEEIVRAAAARYGADGDRLIRLARCSSRLNPLAIGDDGLSLGLFQLSKAPGGLYWHFVAHGYSDPLDAAQSSDYVARAYTGQFAADGVGPWSWLCDPVAEGPRLWSRAGSVPGRAPTAGTAPVPGRV